MRHPRQLVFCTLTLIALLGGCASKGTGSYVVLLRDPDGNLGQVAVRSQVGEQVLTQVFRGTALGGSKEPFFVMQDQLKRDFGAAMGALPPVAQQLPANPRFDTGSTTPTAASVAELVNLAQSIAKLTAAGKALDITVIGHTDTEGDDEKNYQLGLARARATANILSQELQRLGVSNIPIVAESHGEKNLAVKTPDNVAEPRNRRVEITIR